MRGTRLSLVLLMAVVLAVTAQNYQKRQSNYRGRSPQAYYKKPSQPQQTSYYQRPSRQSSYRQKPAYYQQPAVQPAYQQPAAQPAYYQQPAAQPAYYQQPAAQPAYYQQPAAQQAAYYQPLSPPPAPQYYQPQAQLKKPKKEKGQDLSKVPGRAGVDYPIYHTVPETNFHCDSVPAKPGIYANVESGCQAYHVCHDGREGHQGASFLCPNGTLFNQHEFSCDWWYNVNCADAPTLYSLNADPLTNPYSPKPKKEEEQLPGSDYYHP